MSIFRLSIDVSAIYLSNAPTLEVLLNGSVVSAQSVTAHTGFGIDSFDFELEYSGNFPSALSFRFNDGFAEPRSINIAAVRINGTAVNPLTDLSAIIFTQGQSAALTVAAVDHLFGRILPIITDLIEPDNGTAGNDRMRGAGSPDAIAGGDGDDVIVGNDGNDIILGEDGNDRLNGGPGDDALFGGDGNDMLSGSNGNDLLNGGAGNDRLIGEDGDDILYGEDGNDILLGDDGNDTLYGDAGNDRLMGGAGDDVIYGGDDDDMINGDAGNDTLYGDAGDDQILGGAGNDTIYGGTGADLITGGTGDDIVNGGTQNDILFGEAGSDTLNGDDGSDTLMGGAGADTLNGGEGNDILHGHSPDLAMISQIQRNNTGVFFNMETGSFYRYVAGGTQYASAKAAAESTMINGVAGHIVTINDAVENAYVRSLAGTAEVWLGVNDAGTEGAWRYDGGIAHGMQFWSGAVGGSIVNNFYNNWAGGEPNDYGSGEDHAVMRGDGLWNDLVGTDNRGYVIEWEGGLFADDNAADTLHGGNGDDYLYGYGGDDILNGNAGNDKIFGGAGNDTINGGDNDDVIIGGAGNNVILGGAGNDTIYAYSADISGSGDAGATWYSTSWGYRQEISVDSGSVNNDLTDFTILLNGSGLDASFWSNVKGDGSDIVVTLADGTKLDRELVTLNTGAQTMQLFVKIPNLSASVDTELYIYYGNAAGAESNAAS